MEVAFLFRVSSNLKIALIHPFFSDSSTVMLISSTIILRLDNLNATFMGIANEQITCLQKIQNNTVWVTMKKLKRDHITPLLKEFHWLLVKSCIQSSSPPPPLTMRIIGAPQITSQPVLSIFLCSQLPSGTWRTPGLSIPKYCFPTSFSVSLSFSPFHCALQDDFGHT